MKIPPPARQAVLDALPNIESRIVTKTGYSRGTIVYWLKRLRDDKLIRICGYERPEGQGHKFARIFDHGSAPDATCRLKPLPVRIVQAKARERAAKDGRMDDWRKRERTRYWEEKAKAKPTNPFSQLFVHIRKKS